MDFIPARYSILSSDALQQFVGNRYDLSAEMSCVYWLEAQSGGNDMYLIESPPHRSMLRVYVNEASSYAEIDAQAHLCNDLAKAGISVPRVIPSKDGQFVQTLNAAEGIRYVTLTEFIEGSERAVAVGSMRSCLTSNSEFCENSVTSPEI